MSQIKKTDSISKKILNDDALVKIAGGTGDDEEAAKFEALFQFAEQLSSEFPEMESVFTPVIRSMHLEQEAGHSYEDVKSDFLSFVIQYPHVVNKGNILERVVLLP